MGVCCIVCDIDGILFEFFMNFLNIETNIKKKFGVNKNSGGVGRGWNLFFVQKQLFLVSRLMLFSTLKKYIEKCPFTYWLNGRWLLQIVERDSLNLYPFNISSIPLF